MIEEAGKSEIRLSCLASVRVGTCDFAHRTNCYCCGGLLTLAAQNCTRGPTIKIPFMKQKKPLQRKVQLDRQFSDFGSAEQNVSVQTGSLLVMHQSLLILPVWSFDRPFLVYHLAVFGQGRCKGFSSLPIG
jgi:hypothetical protein